MVVTYVLMFVSPEIMESVQMIAWREVTLTDNLHCLSIPSYVVAFVTIVNYKEPTFLKRAW